MAAVWRERRARWRIEQVMRQRLDFAVCFTATLLGVLTLGMVALVVAPFRWAWARARGRA